MTGTTETATQTEVSAPVVAVPEHHAKRTDIVSVTSETFGKFVDEKLGINQETPEQIAQKEFEVIEAKKAADEAEAKAKEDPTHDLDEKVVTKEKKEGINKRFSEVTAARKAAEETATKALAEAKEVFARAEKAEKEASELRAKYEPVKTVEELGAKPSPSNFTDINEYTNALEKWVEDSTIAKQRAESAAKQAEEAKSAALKNWTDRQVAAKAAIPDYDATINESSVALSDQVRDAILDSEVGPQLLYHLAKNPDVAESLGKLTIGKAMIQLGKFEATLSAAPAEKPAAKVTSIAEISRAPAPITPIKAGTSVSTNKIDPVTGEFNGTYDEYKALRKAGKI
jgi:hypothetical protein